MKLWIKVGIAGNLVVLTYEYLYRQGGWLIGMALEWKYWLIPCILIWILSAMFLWKK